MKIMIQVGKLVEKFRRLKWQTRAVAKEIFLKERERERKHESLRSLVIYFANLWMFHFISQPKSSKTLIG
jgi:hypothetical protein